MADALQVVLEEKLGFDKVRSMVCDRCQSNFGATLAADEQFSCDSSEILSRLLLTDEMRMILMFEDSFPASGYIDSLDFLLPLENPNTSLDIVSLRKFRTMLDTLGKVLNFFSKSQPGVYPNLKRQSSAINSFPVVIHRIDSILDRYGNIKDNASTELSRIRGALAEKNSAVQRRANAVLKRAMENGLVDSGAAVSVRDGKFLIPVPAASKHQLNGFIYDESASGKTSFIEPAEVVELTNQIRELEFAQQREIVRILFEFSDFVRPHLNELLDSSRYLGQLDFVIAKAQVALDMAAAMPDFSNDGQLCLRKARHPLLEKALAQDGRKMVPISVTLTPQKRILMVSGPNAGGKSVCLKTVGLLQYMFQWGMLIPTGETSSLPVFDRIEASIGDDQTLEGDLSTYSSFLVNMKNMLSSADSRTLVLIDEMGSGTEPSAGGAIAEAILSSLENAGVYGVITTHYTNLKVYASRPDSAVINGAMAFDASAIKPLFKLEMGLPGNSFAFELARKTGLPESLVRDAEYRAGEEFVSMEKNLRKIARSRKALDEKLERVTKADRTLEDITDRYRKELSEIKALKKKIIEEAQAEAARIVSDANRQVENTIRTIRESQADKSKTAVARNDLRDFIGDLTAAKVSEQAQQDEYVERKLRQLEQRQARNGQRRSRREGERKMAENAEEAARIAREEAFRNAPLQAGEKVRLKDSAMVGEVSKASGGKLVVTVGMMTMKVDVSKVERITSNEYKAAVKDTPVRQASITASDSIRQRKLSFQTEIDIRGQRLSEALETVMHYMDDALMLGVPSVRIIHGKGNGILHEEIQKYIRTVPGVESVSDEHIQFGGSGVTVVRF